MGIIKSNDIVIIFLFFKFLGVPGIKIQLKDRDFLNFFCVAFLGINQFRRVGLKLVCWFYCGSTQRLTESGFMENLCTLAYFMEKPRIESTTPGLQGIGRPLGQVSLWF